MNKFLTFTVVGFAAAAVAACAGTELQNARKVAPSEGAYDQALQQGYLNLSTAEYREGDYVDSDHFAMKSAASGSGSVPGPDDVGSRNLPPDSVADLSAAHDRLVSAQSRGGANVAPVDTARAQVLYDCWLQEQAENRQPEDIAACKEGYEVAIARVEAALMPGAPGAYLAFFGFDEYFLTPEAQQIVAAAAAAANEHPGSQVVAAGHTDTAGSAEYNMGLSQRRADSVASALVNDGIAASAITTEARGESDPLVPTGDGVAEPQNRRVEINVVRPQPGS
jgi:outer membrane protein OmpA-like peptidoglycan-associated protein